MITTAIFDIDGVLTKKRAELFSQRFAKDYAIPLDDVTAFFTTEFPACLTGDADLKEVLVPYLKKWQWQDSVEAFLEYWFRSEPELSTEVLSVIEILRDHDIECYVASEQEKYRAAYLLRLNGLVDLIDGAFFTSILGVRKYTTEFYEKMLKRIGVPAEEVVFWDDTEENVLAAQKAGITAYLYTEFAECNVQVKNILAQNTN